MALTVALLESVIAPEYKVDDCVGVVPLVV
jgi:hypothetical protein